MKDNGSYIEKALTVREVSDILNISTQTVRKMMKEGTIEYFKIGSNYRVKKETIDKLIIHPHGM